MLFNETNHGITLESETFEIDRTDWGLNYHDENSMGIPTDYLIANELQLKIKLVITN